MWDHFDLLAPIYDRVIRPRKPEKLLTLLKDNPDDQILDVGGGTGRISQFFAAAGCRVVVADISQRMLERALEKDGLAAVCAPSEQMPFQDETFSCVIMVDAFHHVIDHRQTALELWRILKPGGRLIIEEPNPRIFSVKLVALAEKLALMRSHFFLPEQIGGYFQFPAAMVTVEAEAPNAFIIVDKG